jgi:hypothetical protein
MRWLLILCLGLLLAAGCDEDAKRTLAPPTGPDYLANDSPDNLMANLVMAWEAMDAEGCAALLYDGVALATDSLAYAPYTFYFDRGINPDLPTLWLRPQEVACLDALLGGGAGVTAWGDTLPGVKSIRFDLDANNVWATVTGGEVDGDPCPEDALWRIYNTEFLFTLKSTVGGTDISAWAGSDRLIMHCIPVQVGVETEWRLWKWREVMVLARAVPDPPERTEDVTLGLIKALYGE